MKFFLPATIVLVTLSACAQQPERISPFYVSTKKFESYSCKQLRIEGERLSRNLDKYSKAQREIANRDAGVAGVTAMVLPLPTVFFLSGGNGPMADEIANTLGKIDAIERVSIRKDCPIDLQAS